MEAAQKSASKIIRSTIRRNFFSLLFPTITVLSIYADLRHTARWKRQQAELQESSRKASKKL